MKKEKKSLENRLVDLAYHFFTGFILMSLLGYYLGQQCGKTFIGVLIGSLLGLFWGFYEVFKLVFAMNREEKTKKVNLEK